MLDDVNCYSKMAISSQLKLLLTAGLLAARSVAVPSQRTLEDDDDDTPLPLVIWHGMLASHRSPLCCR